MVGMNERYCRLDELVGGIQSLIKDAKGLGEDIVSALTEAWEVAQAELSEIEPLAAEENKRDAEYAEREYRRMVS
jgi:hypothetical protein